MHAHKSSRRAAFVLALPALSLTLAGCMRDDLAPDCFQVVDGICVVPGGTAVGIDCATMPRAAVGAEYSFTPPVSGGSGNYTNWMATGLPPGLSIDPQTGALLGRYVAEERDTIRRLRALTETLRSRAKQSGDPDRVAAE